jgi:hypothetical protein
MWPLLDRDGTVNDQNHGSAQYVQHTHLRSCREIFSSPVHKAEFLLRELPHLFLVREQQPHEGDDALLLPAMALQAAHCHTQRHPVLHLQNVHTRVHCLPTCCGCFKRKLIVSRSYAVAAAMAFTCPCVACTVTLALTDPDSIGGTQLYSEMQALILTALVHRPSDINQVAAHIRHTKDNEHCLSSAAKTVSPSVRSDAPQVGARAQSTESRSCPTARTRHSLA